jgi:hypothetical protein
MMTVAKVLASLCGLALVAWGATAPAQAPTTVPDDREISVGRWEVVSVESNGRPDGSWAVLFKRLPVAEGTSTYRQDESPKTFEMATLGSESIKPSRYTGIYKHDGDTRVLCLAPDGKPRPDEFTAPKRSHRTLVTLKRASEP